MTASVFIVRWYWDIVCFRCVNLFIVIRWRLMAWRTQWRAFNQNCTCRHHATVWCWLPISRITVLHFDCIREFFLRTHGKKSQIIKNSICFHLNQWVLKVLWLSFTKKINQNKQFDAVRWGYVLILFLLRKNKSMIDYDSTKMKRCSSSCTWIENHCKNSHPMTQSHNLSSAKFARAYCDGTSHSSFFKWYAISGIWFKIKLDRCKCKKWQFCVR